jgi:hypothetical protein
VVESEIYSGGCELIEPLAEGGGQYLCCSWLCEALSLSVKCWLCCAASELLDCVDAGGS